MRIAAAIQSNKSTTKCSPNLKNNKCECSREGKALLLPSLTIKIKINLKRIREAIHRKKVTFLWTLSVPPLPPPPPGSTFALGGSFF